MTKYQVEFADEAWTKIKSQIRFIAVDRQAPINAAKWSNRLLKAIDDLELMPRRHTLDRQQTYEHGVDVYKFVFERAYLIFYTIDDDAQRVVVVAFAHGRQQ